MSPATSDEKAIDPERSIVDSHHHFWDHLDAPQGYSFPRFLLPEFLDTIKTSGHNITRSVFVQCRAMYRAEGPEELRPVGETEFVNGIAAMSASGIYGPCRAAAGIVGYADLLLGDRVKAVLEAHIAAGNGRFRGIRASTAYLETGAFGGPPSAANKGIMRDATFRRGVAQLAPLGLSWDVSCFHPQLGELAEIAGAFPETLVILNHVGLPLNIGPYAHKEKEVFAAWRKGISDLPRRPNVVVKLGGLGMDLSAPVGSLRKNLTSAFLSKQWKPYFDACIEAFGSERCMFESNFAPDSTACSYGTIWNTFKIVTSGYSESEKTLLFSETAKRVYRLT